ncbi:MAG TPA: hypothetical protein VF850_12180 [Gemmatimonadaceae bacterium]
MISKSGLEIETKGKREETEGTFRGDLLHVTGDTSEHLKRRVQEAKGQFQKDFGKTARKL